MYVVHSKSKPRIADVIRYSRVPPSILRMVLMELGLSDTKQLLNRVEKFFVLGSEGEEVVELELSVDDLRNTLFVVDWAGVVKSRSMNGRAVFVKPPIRTGILRYDAVSLLYAVLKHVVRIEPLQRCECATKCIEVDIHKLLYLARKALESSIHLDSCRLLEPHALVSVMNKLLRERGLVGELGEAVIEERLDGCRQRISIDVFDTPRLEFVGRVHIDVRSNVVEILCDEHLSRALRGVCRSCMCLYPELSEVELCGARISLSTKGVDYGLVGLFGI